MTRPDLTEVHRKRLDTLHSRLHDQTHDYREAFATQHTPLTIIRAAHRIYYLHAVGEPEFMDQLTSLRSHLRPYIEGVNFNQLSDTQETQIQHELVTLIRRDADQNSNRQYFLDRLLPVIADIPTGPQLTPLNANAMAYYTVLRLEEMIAEKEYEKAFEKRLRRKPRDDEKVDTQYKPESAMLNNGITDALLHMPLNHFLKHAEDFYKTALALTRLKLGDAYIRGMQEYLYSIYKGAISAAAGSIEFQRMMPPGTEFHLSYLYHDIDPSYHFDGYMLNFADATFVGVLQAKSSSSDIGAGRPFVVSRRGQQLDLTASVEDMYFHASPAARVYPVASFVVGPNQQGQPTLVPVGVAYWQPTFRTDGKMSNTFKITPPKLTKPFEVVKEVVQNTHTHLFQQTDPTLPLNPAGVTALVTCVNYRPLEEVQQRQKLPYNERMSNLIYAFYDYATRRGLTRHREYFE